MALNEPKNFMEVMVNRRNWIDFLKQPERKKAIMRLDAGDESRCCLGHACFLFGEKIIKCANGIAYGDTLNNAYATEMVMKQLGLKNRVGEFGNGLTYKFYRDPETSELHWTYNAEDIAILESDLRIESRYVDSLATLNDDHVLKATPQEIGAFIEQVINGGDHTPFYDQAEWMKRHV